MPLYVIERSIPEGMALMPRRNGRPVAAAKDTRGWLRRWLAAFYAGLSDAPRMSSWTSNIDWTGGRVD